MSLLTCLKQMNTLASTEVYFEPSWGPILWWSVFVKIVNDWNPLTLTIFAQSDVGLGSKYASAINIAIYIRLVYFLVYISGNNYWKPIHLLLEACCSFPLQYLLQQCQVFKVNIYDFCYWGFFIQKQNKLNCKTFYQHQVLSNG